MTLSATLTISDVVRGI